MSPLTLRRYRAERLLRDEFQGLRDRVLASVRGRLRAGGVHLDPADLEACYAQAWQGLYVALLDEEEISNPAGWLVLVTFRRAIEEHRGRMRFVPERERVQARDLAAELDDRTRLRQLFEGLRGRLSARECEAAVLCYLQGLTRQEAAARMGLSEARMRKLMEGPGAGRPGVAGKVGALVETIRGGGWCEEQGSLMRALAYGMLDPEGERHRLALSHRGECPACRAYVRSLRGLAAVLPAVFPHAGLGAAAPALAGEHAHAGLGALAGPGASGSATGTGLQVGTGAGAMSATGAAGVGGAGGGWLLGGLGAKLAVGCVLALGVGAGCVALGVGLEGPRPLHHRRQSARALGGRLGGTPAAEPPLTAGEGLAGGSSRRDRARTRARPAGPAQVSVSGGEFAPEGFAARAAGAPAGQPRVRPSSSVAYGATREFAPG
jgi:DNA-directed RNA polymerase specialized sigma24 family protein